MSDQHLEPLEVIELPPVFASSRVEIEVLMENLARVVRNEGRLLARLDHLEERLREGPTFPARLS